MATTVEDAVDSTVQLDANVDINLIDDEDLLRKLWQCNEDFSEKRRIRARMYKLREKRLKDFYTNDDVLGVGEGSTSRSASPFTMMEAQTAPENGNVSMASSSTVTSYSYTTSSTSTGGDMEVDQPEGAASRRLSRRQMAEQNKRRGSDELDDAISEKIRRKSSERTKRYQKILSEISSSESATADGEASQPAPAPADDETVRRAEDLGFSTQNTMEGSASVDDVDSPHKINSRSVTSRQSTVETTTTRSERRSSAGGPKVVQQSTVQSQVDEASRQGSLTTSSPSMKTIEHSFSSSSSSRSTGLPTFHNSGDGSIVAASPWPATGAFSQELRKKSSRREVREGDIITAIEVTETWRRVREDDHSAPITQRVTVTKTTRQRASDGVLLEENEDEVIDDIDDGPSTTTADAVLSSSSSSSKTMTSTVSSSTTSAAQATDQTQEVVEEPFVKKEAFLVCEDTPPVVDTSDLTALEASIASDIIIKEAAAEPEPAEEIEEIEVETEPKVQSQEPEAAVQSEPESELVAQLEAEAESEQEGKTETEMDADYVDGAKSTCVESTTTTTTVRSSSSTVPWRLSRQESTESSTTTTTSAAAAETVPWRLAREETSLKIKRTSSQSPSRIAKRRPDAGGATTTKMEVEVAPGRRTTTTTTTSSSARNVGGVKQTSSSSSTSRVTMRSPLKDKAAPSAIPKLLNAAQSPRGNSTLSTSSPRNRVEQRVDSSELRTSPSPTRRPSNGASDLMDDSVDEFVRLEQQLEKESCSQVEEESAYARDILSRPSVLKLSKSASVERSPSPSSIKRQTLKSGNLASPTSPKRGADAKVSSPLRSQRPQSPLVTEQRRVATSSGESRTVKKSSPVSSTLSGLRTPTSSSSPRNSPRSSPAASLLKPGTLVRTIETTRTVTVRDHDDKPWRINSKKDVTKTTSSAGNVRALFDSAGASSGRRNLHGNVMNVVEKYVDTDGCAIHGHHNQSESTHSSRSRNERTTTSTSSSMSRSNRLDEKSRSEARTQDRSPIESEDREPEEQEEQVDDPEQPDEEEESTRSESPLPLPPIDLKALEEDSDRLEHYEVEPIPDAATGTDGVDDGLVSADTTDADAELVEPEPLENGRFREPLSVDRINRPSAEPSTSERIRTEEGVQEASTESKRSERPSLLFNRPASPSKEKMAVVSPVLGSPSVVLKALSRFDGPEKAAPADTEPTAEVSVSKSVSAVETSTTTTARASISKIRSAFESPTSTTSSLTSTLRRTTKEEKGNGRLRSLFEKPTPMSPAAPSVVPAAKPEPVVAPEVIPEPEPTTADEEPCVVQQQQMLTEPAEPVVAAEPAEPVQEDVVPATTTAPTIEEINDLTLLENMLNTATSYDDRCRIRAQLRIVRKKQGVTGSSPMTSRRTPSQTTSSHTSVSSESNSVSRRTYASTPSAKKAVEPQPSVDEPSPEAPQQANVQQTETVETTTTLVTDSPVVDVEQTDSSTSRVWSSSTRVVTRRSTSQLMTVTQTTESAVEDVVQTSSNDEQVVETVATEESADSTSVTEPSSSTAKDSDLKLLTDTSPVKNNPWKKMVERSESGSSLEEKSERTVRTLTTKKSQSELKIWSRLPEPDAALPEMAATLDITSSYGTGPTDEHGRPLFGLGALRRRPKQTSITDSTSNTPEPIIIERSQTLNELQKLHEQQQTQQKETDQPTPAEKPRAKLRDTFTTPSKLGEEEEETDSSLEKEPIISERSQALKDIIRRHEHVTSEILMVNEPPPSPKPKAKLKDSFVLPEADEEVAEEVVPREPVVERSQSFQTIVKRHQELSQVTEQTSSPSQVTSAPASPIKRPGILKKPKDWSPSPSPQELASPARDASPSPKQTPAEDATASLASTVTNTTTATTTAIPRKNSIEIQLNPIDNHLVVVQQLPQAEIVGRRSSVITTYTTSTITTNKLTSQEETDEQVSSSSYPKEEPTPVPTRKTSIEIEPIRKSTSTWSSAVVEESQAIPEAEPTRTSSRFSSRVTTSKTSSSSTSEEPESWRVNSRLISSRTTEGVTKNDEEAPVTSRYTSRFSSRTDSTPSTVTSRFSKFTSRNPTEEPKTSSETANASRFSSSVSRRFTSRTSEVDSDASKTTAESTDAAPATVVPKEEDEVVSSRPSSSRLASRTSTVETTTTSRRFTTKSSDTDSEASKTVPEATDVAPTTVPPKEEEEVASPRPSSNRFASRTSTVETTTTSRRFTTKSSDTDSEASKTVPEATDAAPTTVPPKEEEEVASPRPSSNRFASRTSTVETTRTSRRFTTKSSDADAEASKTASEPMDAEPTETPKVEDDVVSPRPSSNRFSTKTSNVETTTTSRRFITRNSDADSDAPKTAETYRLEEIVSPRSASNRFVSKRSTLETTTSRDRFATSNSEVDSDVPVTSSGDADSTVTKTTTVSQMEVDAPTTTTRFSSSSRSSRFTSRTADSEPTQKATAAATEVQDEYVPIKITSRLSSSRFASANRQVDSSSVKSASSKQVEDESVAVSQRSTSAGHRSDSDVGSSTTQVTSMKLDVDNSQSAELKLTGDATGHTIHSTSTFQLVQPSSEGADDATPWRSKSTSREGSASPVRSRQSIQEVSAAIRAEVTQLTRQTSESGDALVREKSRKFSGEVAPARVSAESKTTGRLPASRYILQRQTSESLKLKPMAPRASVRALAQRFQSNSEEVTTQRKNSASSYPKAGLIFRSNSFRQKSCSPERETGRLSSSSVQRSESMRSGETTTRYRNRTSVDRQSEERDASCQSTAVVEPSSATESHTTVTTTSYQTTSRILPCDEPSTTEVTLELSPATASTTTTSTTTSSRSFLQDRTPIRGVQDILGRMKAGPETNGGHTTEDQHALSLLNKFLGAQILVQCTEPLVRSQSPGLAETVVTTSEQLSEDGKSLTRTRTANQEGSQHQVTSGSDDQGRAWTQQSSSSVSASHTVSTTQSLDDRSPSSMAEACIVDGVDINTCTDDFKLNELLDNCNEYETRCKLRARIKFLLNNTKADGIDGPEMDTGAGESHSDVANASSTSSATTASSSSSSSSTSSPSSCSSSSSPISSSPSPSSSSARLKNLRRSQSTSSSSCTSPSASSGPCSAPTVLACPVPTESISHVTTRAMAASNDQRQSNQSTDRVFDWVREGLGSQEPKTTEGSNESGSTSAATAGVEVEVMDDSVDSIVLKSSASSERGEANSAGELFDSGTESGEDTTKSHHSEPDLTSFMENLKMSLELNQSPHSASAASSSKAAPESTTGADENMDGCGGGGVGIDPFLTQVDVVLNRLKTSLQSSMAGDDVPRVDTSDAPSTEDHLMFLSDNQEVLHNYIAAGGLSDDQQSWKVDSPQRHELISLIDRLQTSLHDLKNQRSNVVSPSSSVNSPLPKPAPATPVIVEVPAVAQTQSAPSTPTPSRNNSNSSSESSVSLVKNKALAWRADFLKPVTQPVASRPIWCRRDSGAGNKGSGALVPASRVLLERPGVRGRFVHQPELQPTPKVVASQPRPVIPGLKLQSLVSPSTPKLLTTSNNISDNKGVTCGSLTVRVNRNEEQGLVLKVGQLSTAAPSNGPSTTVSSNNSRTDDSMARSPLPVDSVGSTAKVSAPLEAHPSPASADVTPVLATKSERRAGGAVELPWKVKLAKKRTERSQTSVMEGALSVDLRKSIQHAANRKSMEDLFAANATTVDESVHAEPEKTSKVPLVSSFPILKQKSMSDLYAARPKPFERSESYPDPDTILSLADDKGEICVSESEEEIAIGNKEEPDDENEMKETVSSKQTAEEAAPPSVASTSVDIQSTVRVTDDQHITTATLTMSSSTDSTARVESDVTTGPVVPAPTTSKKEPVSLQSPMEDPSQGLFTASELIQIGIHKAAIQKQISAEEARRRSGEPRYRKLSESGDMISSPVPDAKLVQAPTLAPSTVASAMTKTTLQQKKDALKGRARRSNTIAITQPSASQQYSGSGPSWWKPASLYTPIEFVPKTDKDIKFQNFLERNKVATGVGVQSVRLAFQPTTQSGAFGMWNNKFSNIRSNFEGGSEPTPSRSRRSSEEPSTGAAGTIASVNVQVASAVTKSSPLEVTTKNKQTDSAPLFSSKAIAAACANAARIAAATRKSVKVDQSKAEPVAAPAHVAPVSAPVKASAPISVKNPVPLNMVVPAPFTIKTEAPVRAKAPDVVPAHVATPVPVKMTVSVPFAEAAVPVPAKVIVPPTKMEAPVPAKAPVKVMTPLSAKNPVKVTNPVSAKAPVKVSNPVQTKALVKVKNQVPAKVPLKVAAPVQVKVTGQAPVEIATTVPVVPTIRASDLSISTPAARAPMTLPAAGVGNTIVKSSSNSVTSSTSSTPNDAESAMHVVLDTSQGRLTVKSEPASKKKTPSRESPIAEATLKVDGLVRNSGVVKDELKTTVGANATNSHPPAPLPAIARLRTERSLSSIRTSDSTHSINKDDDDDKDGAYGDDEASSTTSSSSSASSSASSSDDSSDEDDAPAPVPLKNTAIENLSNIIHKFSSTDDVPSLSQRLVASSTPVTETIKPTKSIAPVTSQAPSMRASATIASKWTPPLRSTEVPTTRVIPAGLKTGLVKSFSTHVFNKDDPALAGPVGVGALKPTVNRNSYSIARTKSATSTFAPLKMVPPLLTEQPPTPLLRPEAIKASPSEVNRRQTLTLNSTSPRPEVIQAPVPEVNRRKTLTLSAPFLQPEVIQAPVPEVNRRKTLTLSSPFLQPEVIQAPAPEVNRRKTLTLSSPFLKPEVVQAPTPEVNRRQTLTLSSPFLRPEAIQAPTPEVNRRQTLTFSSTSFLSDPSNSLSAALNYRPRSLSAQRFLEPTGPTLVGLMASNVSPTFGRPGTNNNNSVLSSAQNFAPGLHEASATKADYSATNSVIRSVSSSRLISDAKEQLSKKDCPLVISSRPRPQSLMILPVTGTTKPIGGDSGSGEPSPIGVRRTGSGSVRAVTVGTKQYEACLSPDSAEKKQREILQFFGSTASTPVLSTSTTTTVSKKVSTQQSTVVKSPTNTMKLRSKTSAASSAPLNAQRPRAANAAVVDEFQLDDLISDVDEVFEKLLADTDSLKRPVSRSCATGKAAQARRPQAPTPSVQARIQLEPQPSSQPNKFADRRRAWEESSACKLHINQAAFNLSCPAEGIKTSGRNFGSSVMTQNQVTRQTTTRSGPSAFAKFQQLDKSAKTSPSGSPVGSPQIKLFRSDSYGPKDMLLHWCKFRTKAYKSINIENFSTSWNDGMAFCALIHHFYPDAFDFDELSPSNKAYNFELAFKTADERAGIARLLDVEDMVAMQRPDWKCVFTYVQMFYRRFKDEV